MCMVGGLHSLGVPGPAPAPACSRWRRVRQQREPGGVEGHRGGPRPPLSCRRHPLAPARFLSPAAAIFGPRLGKSRMAVPQRGRWRGTARHVHEPSRARGHNHAAGHPPVTSPPSPVTPHCPSSHPCAALVHPPATSPSAGGTSHRCGVGGATSSGPVLNPPPVPGGAGQDPAMQGVIAGPSARGIRPRDLPASSTGPRHGRGRNWPSSCSTSDFPCSCIRATLCPPPPAPGPHNIPPPPPIKDPALTRCGSSSD